MASQNLLDDFTDDEADDRAPADPRAAAFGSPPRPRDDEDRGQCAGRVLAVTFCKNVLGVACYAELTNEIFLDECPTTVDDIADIVAGVKNFANPTSVLVSVRTHANEQLMPLLLQSTTEALRHDVALTITKNRDWDLKTAWQNIMNNLEVQRAPNLHAVLSTDQKHAVEALGGLLAFLQTTVFSLEQDRRVRVAGMHAMAGHRRLRLDPVDFRALQIFVEDTHPNEIAGQGRSKEGFSMFSLLDRTVSLLGRATLQDWMRKPLMSVEAIEARQRRVGALIGLLSTGGDMTELRRLLRRVHDIPSILLRFKKVASTGVADWHKLFASLEACIGVATQGSAIHRRCVATGDAAAADVVDALTRPLDLAVVQFCRDALRNAIDFEVSLERKDVVFNEGYDADLDQLNEHWGGLEEVLQAIESELRRAYPSFPQRGLRLAVDFLPQIGFLAVCRAEDFHLHRETLASSGFTSWLEQDGAFYLKHALLLEADDEHGDLAAQITDKRDGLVRDLEACVLEHEERVLASFHALGEIDASLALAQTALDLGWTCPTVVDDACLVLKDARHPLQELAVPEFIPNDALLGGRARTAVVTGANFSGKSVYLKTVGVVVYLAHLGSYVPCGRARVGLTDRIFTRVATIETCTLPQSTFMIDATSISRALSGATRRSLVLIDEFGKGTAELDGMALLGAALKALSREGGPRCVVTTHFLELARYLSDGRLGDWASDGSVGFFCTQQLRTSDADDGSSAADERSVPLYRVVRGIATSSDAFQIARQSGLSAAIVERSAAIAAAFENDTPIEPLDIWDAESPIGVELYEHFCSRDDWDCATDEEIDAMRELLNKQE